MKKDNLPSTLAANLRMMGKNLPLFLAGVLLLDKITAALDRDMELQILETVKTISQTKPVVLITHNAGMESFSDYVVTL